MSLLQYVAKTLAAKTPDLTRLPEELKAVYDAAEITPVSGV